MAQGGALVIQRINDILVDQDLNLDFEIFDTDGSPRDLSQATINLTFRANVKGNQIEKSSVEDQILIATPNDHSIRILILSTDISIAGEYKWVLRGSDLDGGNKFVAAYGNWLVIEWLK